MELKIKGTLFLKRYMVKIIIYFLNVKPVVIALVKLDFPQMFIKNSQFFPLSFFLKIALLIQACVFEISNIFRSFALIESF